MGGLIRRLAGIALMAAVLSLLAAPSAEARKYAAFVMDVDSGKVLFARNADVRRHPASLTKIMTLYMVFDALEQGKLTPNQRLKVSARAAGQPCSCLGLKKGGTIKVRDAIRALITKSANDVATVVAEALGGTEYRFAVAMTQRAQQIGLRSTRFMNASGLHNRRQVTTARDMARLGIAIKRDFPAYYHLFSTKKFTWGGRTFRNHNKLLSSYAGTDGIKTGYINASGFNLVSSVERKGTRLIGVVFGGKSGKSRNRHMVKILNTGFKRMDEIRIANIQPPIPLPRPALPGTTPQPTVVAAAAPVEVVAADEVGSRDDSGDWGIQVGAYSTERRAQRSIATARGLQPEMLSDAEGRVERLERNERPVFRARLFGLMEGEARELCLNLKRRHMSCIPVPGIPAGS